MVQRDPTANLLLIFNDLWVCASLQHSALKVSSIINILDECVYFCLIFLVLIASCRGVIRVRGRVFSKIISRPSCQIFVAVWRLEILVILRTVCTQLLYNQ